MLVDDITNQPASKQKQRVQMDTLVQDVIKQLQSKTGFVVMIKEISSLNDCDKRRRSDLLSVFSALNLVEKTMPHSIRWNGEEKMKDFLVSVVVKNEIAAQTQPMEAIFKMTSSPTLPQLVVGFISLYFFLGTDTLSIHSAATLFAPSKSLIKHFTRRLYLIVYIIDKTGIIQRTHPASHYKINLPLDEILQRAFQVLRHNNVFPSWALEYSLSGFSSSYFDQRCSVRREHFNKFIRDNLE